jgi:hypothetical protein
MPPRSVPKEDVRQRQQRQQQQQQQQQPPQQQHHQKQTESLALAAASVYGLSEYSTVCSTPHHDISIASSPASRQRPTRGAGAPGWTKARLAQRLQTRMRNDELARCNDEIRLDDATISQRLRCERQRFVQARERHQQWLRNVLNNVLDSYEIGHEDTCTLHAKESRRLSTLTQQRCSSEHNILAKRELRESRMLQNTLRFEELERKRHHVNMERQAAEEAKTQAHVQHCQEQQRHCRHSRALHDSSIEAVDILKNAIQHQQSRGSYDIKNLRDLVDDLVEAGDSGVLRSSAEADGGGDALPSTK